ncbi:hypothetical protein OsI_00140 [Oryza sativa Indica Group]|uniref:Wall-associated receptor kinase galacturonan-binding domain-containing protein n=1 Tax=Oryza sativa subsp. indica TaxID=39946 RepID=B8ACX6_ORYSI|nr:hypothetical protein OsI_00140 [Oryza sativa Indica Group]
MEAAALSTVLCVLALVVADADHHVVHVQGRRHRQCQPFSCGHLSNITHPFRRRGDPRRCGVSSYELDCSSDDGKATIRINTGKYYVSSIDYTASIFWVVDANLQDDANSSCPLPRSDQLPYVGLGIPGSHDSWDLGLDHRITWVGFVNCSQELITNSSSKYLPVYHPVDCLTTALSFVYYMLPFFGSLVPSVEDIEPSCGYLAMTPIGGGWNSVNLPEYTSYAEVVKSMRGGFAVKFPTDGGPWLNCLADSNDNPLPRVGIKDRIIDILSIDLRFWGCMIGLSREYYLDMRLSISDMIRGVDHSLYHKLFILYTLCLVKWIAAFSYAVLCRAYYPAWVYDQLIADQQVDEISNVADMHELERKLCLVGLWCIQMKSHDRPTMSEAIEMLEGDVDALQVPPRPFFCDGDGIGNGMPPPQVMDSYFHSSELTAISEEDDGIAELASS